MSGIRSRAPFAVVLAAAIALGVFLGDPQPPQRSITRPSGTDGVPALLASGAVRSAAWYCPLASPTRTVSPDDALRISNTGSERLAVEVVGIAARRSVGRRRLDIGGNNSTRLKVTDFNVARDLGLVVEAFGPGVVVEHTAVVGGRETSTPCATKPSDEWHFAAGTTRKNIRESVALMNPFGQSAVIDITLLTKEGVLRPKSMQAIEVAARSKVAVSINTGADQQEVVSVIAKARSGRFIAEMMLVGVGDLATSPLSLQIGLPSLATEWHVVDVDAQSGLQHRVVIANPSDSALDVNVLTLKGGTIAVEQRTVRVAAGSSQLVDPFTADSLKDDVSVIVNARQPFIAGSLHLYEARSRRGVSVGAAMARSAMHWSFGVDHTELLNDAPWLVIENEAAQDAHIEIRAAAGGVRRTVTVPAQQRVSIKLQRNTVVSVVTVDSDRNIYVARRMSGSGGTSRSSGVPTL